LTSKNCSNFLGLFSNILVALFLVPIPIRINLN
jgi:hypothetical protein